MRHPLVHSIDTWTHFLKAVIRARKAKNGFAIGETVEEVSWFWRNIYNLIWSIYQDLILWRLGSRFSEQNRIIWSRTCKFRLITNFFGLETILRLISRKINWNITIWLQLFSFTSYRIRNPGGLLQKRYLISLLICLGTCILIMLQLNLSITIVQMTKGHYETVGNETSYKVSLYWLVFRSLKLIQRYTNRRKKLNEKEILGFLDIFFVFAKVGQKMQKKNTQNPFT